MEDTRKGRLPILIVPGFMSSALEVHESDTRKSWEGKRIWLSLTKLGITGKNGEEFMTTSQNITLKNDWLKHMMLENDMQTEREGVKVRPATGVNAIDYLDKGMFGGQSFVFGPFIHHLEEHGYRTGYDVDAAPYDWRLSPKILESRDNYFSNTIKMIERMRKKHPVVIIGHSMGVKMSCYLMEFAKQTKGQEWINHHVHTLIVAGGPILGAPTTLSSLITGDRMGLPSTFLDDRDALIMGRSLGSVPGLLPVSSDGQKDMNSATAYCTPLIKNHGLLRIVLRKLQTANLRTGKRYRIKIRFDDQVLHSSWIRAGSNESEFVFDENATRVLTFPGPPDLQDANLKISLLEAGLAKDRTQFCPEKCSCTQLCFWTVCCPCMLMYAYVKCVVLLVWKGFAKTMDLMLRSTNYGTSIGSARVSLKQLYDISNCSFGTRVQTTLCIPLYNRYRRRYRTSNFTTELEVQWMGQTEVHAAAGTAYDPDRPFLGDKVSDYTVYTSKEMIELEGLPTALHVWDSHYMSDVKFTVKAPPAPKIRAVYGINKHTELCPIFNRTATAWNPNVFNSQYVHDVKSTIDRSIMRKHGFKLIDGRLFETKKTPQVDLDTGDPVFKSGDGTVPYASLQHVKSWKEGGTLDDVTEIDDMEHRGMLADKRFYEYILDYCLFDEGSVDVPEVQILVQ